MDDAQLYDTFKAFNSELLREETFPSPQRDSMDVKIKEGRKALSQAKESLIALFVTHTKRPPVKKPNAEFHGVPGEAYGRSLNSDPPDIDRLTSEQLVDVIDAMINAAFRNVTEEVSASDRGFKDWSIDVVIGHPRRL